MKKGIKIFAIILSLCVIACAVMLVASAEENAITGDYAVGSTGYTAWADAVAAAGSDKIIRLNSDISASDIYVITGNVTLDLNGHRITDATPTTGLFTVKDKASLRLIGEGSLLGLKSGFNVEAGGTLSVEAMGEGLYMTTSSAASLFNVAPGASASFSGDIKLAPAKLGGSFITIGTKATSLSDVKNSYVTFDGARLSVTDPTNDVRYSLTNGICFATIWEGAQLTIKNQSVIDLEFGNMFSFGSGGYADKYYTGVGSGSAHPDTITGHSELTIRVDVDDSNLYAGNSGYNALKHSGRAGSLISGAYRGFYMTLDNVDLVGCNRTIYGITSRDTYNVASARMEFTNVNFTSTDYISYESSWLTAEKINLVWNGGAIVLKNAKTNSTAEVTIDKTADGDPFGAEAIAAAKAKGVTISPETHRVKMYATANNNGALEDTWAYHLILENYGYTAINGGGMGYAEYVSVKDANTVTGYRLPTEGETPDTWFGIKFTNVAFGTAPGAPTTKPTSTSALYTLEGKYVDNPKVYYSVDESITYDVGYYTTGIVTSVHGYVNKYTTVYNPTSTWIRTTNESNDTTSVTTGTLDIESIAAAVRDFGTASAIAGENGSNGYFKWHLDPAVTGAASKADSGTDDPYFEMKIGPYPSSPSISHSGTELTVTNLNSSDYAISKYKYIVQEFDISTDSGLFPTLSSSLITRGGCITFDSANGTYAGSIQQYQNGINPVRFTDNGKHNPSYSSGATIDQAKGALQIPTNGDWARITLIYEIGEWKSASNYTIGAYTRARVTADLKLHLYIDGVWRASYSTIMKPIDKELKDTIILDALRVYPSATPGASVLIDNTRASYYRVDDLGCEDIAKLLADHKAGFIYNPELSTLPENGKDYSSDKYVGTVDGVKFWSEDKLVRAIKGGSVVELNSDIEALIPAVNAVKIIANGHTFRYNSDVYTAREYSGIYTFSRALGSEIADVYYTDELFGNEANVSLTVGSSVDLSINMFEGSALDGELLYTAVKGWSSDALVGGSVVAEGGRISLVPEYVSEPVAYTASVDGTLAGFGAKDKESIVAKLNALISGAETVIVKLYSDVLTTESSSIAIPAGCDFYFDLNGNVYTSAKNGSKTQVFTSSAGASFYLYSSQEGGVMINTTGTKSGTVATVAGGVIWMHNITNATGYADESASATFGTLKNDALGIDAKGDNLTVISGAIADVYGVYINNATAEKGFTSDADGDGVLDYNGRATVNVDGGSYVRYTSDGLAMFASRAVADFNIRNATIVGDTNVFSTDARFHGIEMNLTVDNCKILGTTSNLEGDKNHRLFGQFHEGSEAHFTNSTLCFNYSFVRANNDFEGTDANFGGHSSEYSEARKNASYTGSVTIGAGCKLSYSTSLPASIKLGTSCKIVPANAKETISYKMPLITYKYTVGGVDYTVDYDDGAVDLSAAPSSYGVVADVSTAPVTVNVEKEILSYVDTEDKLAHITWYDSDGTTALGTALHAPFGSLGNISSPKDLVSGLESGNGWYKNSFDHWSIPTGLKAGEVGAYAICTGKTACVEVMKINVTVYTYFQLNFYLPASVDIDGFSLIGIAEDEEGEKLLPAVTDYIGADKYYKFYDNPGAANAEEETRYIIFEINGERFVDEFDFGIPTYAAYVLQGSYSDVAKALVSNMVRYANESYKLANGETNGLYDALLDSYATGLIDYAEISFTEEETAVGFSDLEGYISGASFMFGAYQPRFAFEYASAGSVLLPEDGSGNIGSWPEDSLGVFTHLYFKNSRGDVIEHIADNVAIDGGVDKTELAVNEGKWDNAGTVYAMSDGIYVYDIRNVINVVVYDADGAAHKGTYSLASYISSLTAGTDAYNAAMSLYAFSLAAEAYRA